VKQKQNVRAPHRTKLDGLSSHPLRNYGPRSGPVPIPTISPVNKVGEACLLLLALGLGSEERALCAPIVQQLERIP
jgi:hypothetical protein